MHFVSEYLQMLRMMDGFMYFEQLYLVHDYMRRKTRLEAEILGY